MSIRFAVARRGLARFAMVLFYCSGPAPAQTAELTCTVGGTTVSVWPVNNTFSRCDQSGVAHSIGATGGDGSLNLSNSEDLVFEAPTEPFGHPALHAYAPPFHIETELDYYRTDVHADGTIEVVPVYKSFFSMNQLTTDSLDLFSQPITISNSGTVTVTGTQGSAITARASTKSATVTNSGDISLTGSFTAGVFVMSGVEQGMFEFLGVAPGTHRPGGAISITNSGDIDIDGNNSVGLMAKTVGGGITIDNRSKLNARGINNTGIRANAESNSISITNSDAITLTGKGGTGIDASIFLPGTLTVTNNGAITISGDLGIGIQVLNSDAGNTGDAAPTRVAGTGAIAVTGEEATGIDATNRVGGSLAVDYSGKIRVEGAYAAGIHAGTDEGADVSVKANADVTAIGASANGIVVSGIGEGISNPDGTVTPKNNGHLSVDVGSGVTVKGGSFGGGGVLERLAAGVAFVGGETNALINRGTITADSGLAVVAVEGTQIMEDDESGQTFNLSLRSGPLDVQNYGTIKGDVVSGSGDDAITNNDHGVMTGNVDLGDGENSFDNLQGAVLNSRDRISVGSGNVFANAGTLSPGGLGAIQSTAIVGNFVQTVNGRMVVDIDQSAAAKADFISVTGTASLAGLINPNEINMGDINAGAHRVLTANGGVTLNGLSATNTVGYDYGVEQRGSNDVYLTASKIGSISQLAASNGSGGNGTAAAQTITTLENSNSPAGQKIGNDLRNLPDGNALTQAIERITPQSGDQQSNSTTSGNASFSNSMLSCASREQPYRFTKEDTCYYAKFTARRLDRDATASSVGFDETGYEFIGGTQVDLGGNLRGGLAFGYEKTTADSQSLTQPLGDSDGDRAHVGLVLKDQWGPINAYLNVAGSYGWYDHTRYINLGGFTNALGEQEVASGLIKLRLSYLHQMGNAYVRPLIDLGATYANLGGYSETGAGPYNLRVKSANEWIFGVSPALEIGGEFADASGTLFRPYIRGGVTVYDKDNMSFSANFASAPVGIAGFTVVSELDSVFADVAAGVQILTLSGTNVKLEYEGRFGEHTSQNAASVKLTMPY